MRPTTDHGHEAGLALVEIVFGVALVAMFISALFTLTAVQGRHRQVNQETSLAMGAAIDTLEQVRSVDVDALPGLHGAGFDVPGSNGRPGGLQPLPDDPDGLPGRLAVAVDRASGGSVLYRVTAAVAWRGVSGSRALQVEALIGERK